MLDPIPFLPFQSAVIPNEAESRNVGAPTFGVRRLCRRFRNRGLGSDRVGGSLAPAGATGACHSPAKAGASSRTPRTATPILGRRADIFCRCLGGVNPPLLLLSG